MPFLLNTATQKVQHVPAEDVLAGVESGKFAFVPGSKVGVSVHGQVVGVSPEDLPSVLGRGAVIASDQQLIEVDREARYGDANVRTFLEGVGRGATFGLIDAFQDPFELEQRQMRSPIAATAGEIVGMVAPALVPGGQFTPAGFVGRTAGRFATGGVTTAGRLVRGAAAGAFEGAVSTGGMVGGTMVARGEDVEVAATEALSQGLFGGAVGGGLGLVGGVLGHGIARTFGKRAETLAAGEVASAVSEELSQYRMILGASGKADKALGKKVATAEALVEGLQKQVDELRASQVDPAVIAERQLEVDDVAKLIRENKGVAARIERDLADDFAGYRQRLSAERSANYDAAAEIALADRLDGDRLWSLTKFLQTRLSLPDDVAAAFKRLQTAEGPFDTLLGGSIVKKGRKARQATFDLPRMAKTIAKDPAAARAAITEYRAASEGVKDALARQGIDFAIPPEGLDPAAGKLILDAQQAAAGLGGRAGKLDEALAGGVDVEGQVAQVRGKATADLEATQARTVDLMVSKGDKQRLLREMRSREGKLRAKEGELERATERRSKLVAERDALHKAAAEVEGLRPLLDEMKELAQKRGFPIGAEDIALSAMAMGLDGDTDLGRDAATVHLLLKMFTGRGLVERLPGRGIASQFLQSGTMRAGREMFRGVASRMLPGKSGLLRDLFVGGMSGVGTQAGKGLAGKVTGRAVRKGAAAEAVAGRSSVADLRARFQARVDKSMARVDKGTTIARRVTVASAASILAETKFHSLQHEGDSKLPPLERNFERRAKELDALVLDPEAMRMTIRTRIQEHAPIPDPVLEEATVEDLQRTYLWLHGKLPPPRATGLGGTRRNATEDQMVSLARAVRYARDPAAVAEDFADGTLTSEGPAFLRDVRPAMYSYLQQRLVERAGELGDKMPYEVRLRARHAFGLSLDATLTPEFAAGIAMTAVPPQPMQPPPPRGELKLRSNAQTEAQRLAEK